MVSIRTGSLEFKNLARETNKHDRVASLTKWAEGVDIFKVPDMLYVPEYGIQVCYGFVPEEAIHYKLSLDARLGRCPGQSQIDSVIDLDSCDRSSAEVCILGHMDSHIFGHWVTELLKVVLLEEFGFTGPYVIKPGYPSCCRESLDLLGIQSERIIVADRSTIYKAAFLTTPVHLFTAARFPMVICYLRDRLYEAAGCATGVGHRVWAERGVRTAGRGGDIINRQEVNECIGRYGFVSVDFAQYAFKEQIAIDRDVDIIAGPHGSAFVHCGFMRHHRDVVEIFSPARIWMHSIQLCQVMQHHYSQIVPAHVWNIIPYQFGTEIMVDTDHLDLVLSSASARRSQRFSSRCR